MNCIYLEHNAKAIEKFRKISSEICSMERVRCFSEYPPVLEDICKNHVDIVFIEMELPDTDVISLAQKIQELSKDLYIVFFVEHPDQAMKAFEAAADGCLLKTYCKEDLERQINLIRKKYHIEEYPKVYFQTIPRFELYVDNRLVPISKKKVKELLALLVDYAGSSLTCEQAINCIWEERLIDEGSQALLRMTAKRLREFLVQENISHILIEENGVRAIDMKYVDSDYYQILNGNEEAMKKYCGEYMREYSWAEITNAMLFQITGRLAEELL